MEAKLRAAIAAIKGVKIPDLPKEIMELDEELSRKFPNNQTIVAIIHANTKLSGEVIRIANLPALKPKTVIKSVKEAVDNLGHDNLKNLLVSAAMQNLFNQREVSEIIDHSSEVAFCCAEMAEFLADVTRDEAYLLGLFHNCGALLLAVKDPENYPKLFSKINTHPVAGLASEEELYGSNHTVVGILLAQKWKLSLDMINAIMNHHIDECGRLNDDRIRGMVAMLKIANHIVNEISYGSYMTADAKNHFHLAKDELMMEDKDINLIRQSLLSCSA